MFCTNCGNQLSDEAKFCPGCGAKVLTAAPETTEEVKTETEEVREEVKEEAVEETVAEEKVETVEAEPETSEEKKQTTEKRKIFDSNDTPKTVIQLVAVIFGVTFAGIFLSHFVGGAFSAIGDIFTIFTHPIRAISNLVRDILRIATGAAAAGITVLYIIMILRWKEEKANDFLISLASLGIFGIIVKLIACIIYSLMKYNTWKSFGELVGWVVLSVAVMYGIFVAFKIPALQNIDTANIKELVTSSLLNVYEDAKEEYEILQAHQKAKKEAQNQFNAEQAATGVNVTTGRPFVPLATDRSLIKLILLNIVTCGIYSWIFTYRLAEDVNVACDGDGDHTPGLLALVILSTVTCGIYGIIWYYKLGNRLQVNARRYGMEFPENGTTILLWLLLGSWLCGIGTIIALHILIKNTNLICTAYNNYNTQNK